MYRKKHAIITKGLTTAQSFKNRILVNNIVQTEFQLQSHFCAFIIFNDYFKSQ